MKEIENYYYQIDISSNFAIMTSIISGAGKEYIEPYSDGLLKQINQNKQVKHILDNCSINTKQFFSKYYSDAPILIQIKSWAGDYSKYLYCIYGLIELENISNSNSEKKQYILNLAKSNKEKALAEYNKIKNILVKTNG
jgi:hypothetical protein